MRCRLIYCALAGIFFCMSCTHEKPPAYKIGFSQCTGADAWRRQMLASMQRELAFHPELSLVFRDAGGNSAKQIDDIKDLVSNGIDLLVVSPNESEPITPVVENVFDSGIPVIVVDRRTSSSRYTAYIGSDNREIGRLAGKYAVDLLNGKGKILEIWGLHGSSPAADRHEGFTEIIEKYPNLAVLALNGEWELDTARNRLTRMITDLEPFDLVFAHNDVMAYGAYTVCKAHDPGNKIHFLGIDGLPGSSAGIQFVSDGILDATFLYSTGGEEAIRIASRILNRQDFEKEYMLSSTTIDRENVRVMKLQTDKIASQQEDIIRQQGMITSQIQTFHSQRYLIYILLVSLTIMIVAGSAAFLAWREVKVMNARLNSKNKEIIIQRNKIAEMAAAAETATEQKLKFFADVSHEFQTPLALILDPVEELLHEETVSGLSRENLKLARKNALRLMLLVNQLMDFVKIDSSKMSVHVTRNDIVRFIEDIMADFQKTARKQRIDFRLLTDLETLEVWFDDKKIDKVIFNLLSNAFKYTQDGGRIYVRISMLESGSHAIIVFEDNGRGMSASQVAHVFDRFFSGSRFADAGTGIGLALSKEYVELHHGNISVSSEILKGTQFVIALPLGNAHFLESEIVLPGSKSAWSPDYSGLLEDINNEPGIQTEEPASKREHTILIIDDNAEFRQYLRHRLESHYFVAEAADGRSGIHKAFEMVPDLIICDVIMPGKEGLEVSKVLKDDLRTSHIPVVLLTAKRTVNERIAGLQVGVDAYITKPFLFEYLYERIRALIRGRQILKEHYSRDLYPDVNHSGQGTLDRKFISHFTSIVRKNMSNSEFNVNHIAQELGMSKVQVYRKAKALMGLSVNDYVVSVRLKTARQLLIDSQKSIAEIAYEVGFSSPAYFSTSFRTKYNITPSELRGFQVAQS